MKKIIFGVVMLATLAVPVFAQEKTVIEVGGASEEKELPETYQGIEEFPLMEATPEYATISNPDNGKEVIVPVDPAFYESGEADDFADLGEEMDEAAKSIGLPTREEIAQRSEKIWAKVPKDPQYFEGVDGFRLDEELAEAEKELELEEREQKLKVQPVKIIVEPEWDHMTVREQENYCYDLLFSTMQRKGYKGGIKKKAAKAAELLLKAPEKWMPTGNKYVGIQREISNFYIQISLKKVPRQVLKKELKKYEKRKAKNEVYVR